jgi:type I restriction enzyme S subunit
VNVATVFDTTSGTTFDIGMEKEAGAYMYVKVGDMNLPGNEFEITTSSRFIDPDKKTAKALIPTGSIIFPKRGGAIATNKKRIVCTPIFVDLNTMAITPVLVLTAYAFLWLTTIDLASLNTGTSVPQINHKDIDPLPFPLAPLSEQSRIVNRVNELRSLCADLRQRLTAGQAVQSHLADALATV